MPRSPGGGQKAFHTTIAKNYQPPRPEFCTDELFGPGFAFSALCAKSLNRHWSTTDIIIKLLVYWACSCCCCKNPITACCCFRRCSSPMATSRCNRSKISVRYCGCCWASCCCCCCCGCENLI